MPKNIVICLDGTGQQFGRNESNVVTIFRVLDRGPGRQIAYYDPGVGTMGDPAYKTWIARKINKLLGLAFGRGLQKNVVEAYTYLMEHYEEGDRVFLFGFSRGAYAARMLATFIEECGLLDKGSHNLIPYALRRFHRGPRRGRETKERGEKPDPAFRQTFGRKLAGDKGFQIEFLGLFDTVKSYGWLWKTWSSRHEQSNPSAVCVRHALAIDERRASFRPMHFFSSPGQCCKEVWFAGAHFDVGGGWPEAESGLAKIALRWMIDEALGRGLEVDPSSYDLFVLGRDPQRLGEREQPPITYVGPDPAAAAHRSLGGWWWLLQLLPKRWEPWEERRWRRTIKGERARARLAEPQPLRVHRSVVERMRAVPGYRPWNLLQRRKRRWFAEAVMASGEVRGELPDGCEIEG